MRSTYTYVILHLSKAAYDEIAHKLKEAQYHHAFHEDGVIDMHGLAVQVEPEAKGPENEAIYISQTTLRESMEAQEDEDSE